MQIYDISQELFGCAVFPGDPAPRREILSEIAAGAACNLTAFSMCAHNGTHIDAPFHFLHDGKTIEQIPLTKLVGPAFVAAHTGTLTADDAAAILSRACRHAPEAVRRILIKGKAVVSLEAAEVFAKAKIDLLGNESQTVGPETAPMAVHRLLLGREIVLLEGIRLQEVPEGVYLLSAAPLSLTGADGSPCRAILLDMQA
ncbi:MAG: cyclase family protein [Clostridia bacterium]|nr:cyclase family protein [Clostridia bacterium]